MIDGDDRQLARPRDAARERHTDQQAADQPRTGRDGEALDIAPFRSGIVERA